MQALVRYFEVVLAENTAFLEDFIYFACCCAVHSGLFHEKYRTSVEICPPLQALARYFEVVLAENTAII